MPMIHSSFASPAAEDRADLLDAVVPRFRLGRVRQEGPAGLKVKRRDLAFILRNLATLVGNGLVLPKSLGTLARERTVRKYADMLSGLQRKVEKGETFSSALAAYPRTFNDVLVNQIRAGEASGTLSAALKRVAKQVENANSVRSKVMRQLAYPMVLMVAGSLAVAFMLLFVIPVFEKTYEDANVPLPMVTQVLMSAGQCAYSYGWILPVALLATCLVLKRARRR